MYCFLSMKCWACMYSWYKEQTKKRASTRAIDDWNLPNAATSLLCVSRPPLYCSQLARSIPRDGHLFHCNSISTESTKVCTSTAQWRAFVAPSDRAPSLPLSLHIHISMTNAIVAPLPCGGVVTPPQPPSPELTPDSYPRQLGHTSRCSPAMPHVGITL